MNLKQLSQSLGLSQTTVSRALNGYPEVAEATRLKVLQAAQAHNYRPNARARGLATGRTMAVGHVIPVSSQHEIVNPVFSDFIAGAGEVYQSHGYDMVISMVADADESRVYCDIAARASVDGIMVHSPRTRDPRVALLRQIGLPFVVHGRVSQDDDSYDWVDMNNRRAFRRATDFLLDLGHRRIALVNGPERLDFAQRRLRGYRDALAARGMTADPDLIHFGEMTDAHGYAAARRALDLPDPATAMLASSLITTLGIKRALDDAGLQTPGDVSVITHDDALSYLCNGDDVPVFTATRSSIRLAGRLCAERLIELIETPGKAPRHTLLEAQLTVGGSTGPVPASRSSRRQGGIPISPVAASDDGMP